MTVNIVDVSVFSDPVTAPATDEEADQATFLAGLQLLANRTRFLLDNPGAPALAANQFLARASAGAAEGKASSDFSLTQMALTSSVGWADGLATKGSDIPSAATTNIAGASGPFVHVTGVTTIDSFGTANPGVRRWVRFAESLTLTHSGNLIMPGGVNVTTFADDVLLAISEGSGVWRVASYIGQGADVQSVTAAAGQNVVQISPTMGAVVLTPINQEIETTNFNTAFGLNAGNVGGWGSAFRNTSFGEGANAALADGDDNTAFGYNALSQAASQTTRNVMIGSGAGSTLRGVGEDQPINNVGVGYEALMGSGLADGVAASTAIGYQALKNVAGDPSTSQNNTALGYRAGVNVVDGQHNTLLGPNTAATLVSGDSNIVIGTSQDVPTAGTANHLNIGGTIFADLANDRVRIGGSGLVPADGALQVAGDFSFGVATSSPTIYQVTDSTPSATGVTLLFHGQDMSGGSGTTGAPLHLRGGTGDTAGDVHIVGSGVLNLISAVATVGFTVSSAVPAPAFNGVTAGGEAAPILILNTSAGTNGGTTAVTVGDRTPEGNVVGNGGAIHVRDDGVSSTVYVKQVDGGNTGWADLLAGVAETLQDVYDNGPGTLVLAAGKPLAISATSAVTVDPLFEVTTVGAGTGSGIRLNMIAPWSGFGIDIQYAVTNVAGAAISIDTAAGVTGDGILIDHNSTGANSDAFSILMDAAAIGRGISVLHGASTGGSKLMNLENAITAMVQINTDGTILIDGNNNGAVQVTAEGTGICAMATLGSGNLQLYAAGTGEVDMQSLASSIGIEAFTDVNINATDDLNLTANAIAMYGGTAVTQPADPGALTDSTTGTANGTVVAISGSGADSDINDNFADLLVKYNALRDMLSAGAGGIGVAA